MKTAMHENSLAAYEKIDLTNNQKIVLAAFRRGEGTDEQIALRLKWSINRVTGRIHELLEFEKLEVCGEAVSEFGNKVRVCRIKVKETLF
jgi:DNA-binding NarL/FixJ family response regulator